jgi:hypothetical protein
MSYDDFPTRMNWTSLLKAVRTPLSFLTLVLLITQSILSFLLRNATGIEHQIALYAMLAMTFVLVGVVAFLQYKKTVDREFTLVTPKTEQENIYDAFLSAPMAALSQKDYGDQREIALEAIETLEKECGMKAIFFAGKNIKTQNDFDPSDAAVKEDLDAIAKCKLFVMLYPARKASSVLFEAGCALALGKNCVYFVRNRNHLPFLLQEAEQAFTNIKVYQFDTVEELKKKLKHANTFKFE